LSLEAETSISPLLVLAEVMAESLTGSSDDAVSFNGGALTSRASNECNEAPRVLSDGPHRVWQPPVGGGGVGEQHKERHRWPKETRKSKKK